MMFDQHCIAIRRQISVAKQQFEAIGVVLRIRSDRSEVAQT